VLEAVSGCERASTASSGCAWSSESPISSPLPTSLIVEAKISSPSWSDSSKSIRVLSTGSRRWGEGVRVDDPADGEGCIGDPTSVGAGSLSPAHSGEALCPQTTESELDSKHLASPVGNRDL
jgi:hypothetical protein